MARYQLIATTTTDRRPADVTIDDHYTMTELLTLRYPIKPPPLGIAGGIMAVFCVPFVLLAGVRLYTFAFVPNALDLHIVDFVILMGLSLFGGFAAYGLGLPIKFPGISGHVLTQAGWSPATHSARVMI